jgi:hypothetical protein
MRILTEYHQTEIARTTNERLPLKDQLTVEETQRIDTKIETQHIDTKIISEITNKRKKEHTTLDHQPRDTGTTTIIIFDQKIL